MIKMISGDLRASALARAWKHELSKLRSGKYPKEELQLEVDPVSVKCAKLANGLQVHFRPGVVPRLLAQEAENNDPRLKIHGFSSRPKPGEFHFSALPAHEAFAEFEYKDEVFRVFPTRFATREYMFLIASMSRTSQLLHWSDISLLQELADQGLIVLFNSIGAGASKPFSFHLQATIGKFALETAPTQWVDLHLKDRGAFRTGHGYYTYPEHPMKNLIFDGGKAYLNALVLIESLNSHGFSYNLAGFRDRAVSFPKMDLHRGMPGAIECLGNVNASSPEEFETLSTDPSAMAERIFRHSMNSGVLDNFMQVADPGVFRTIYATTRPERPEVTGKVYDT